MNKFFFLICIFSSLFFVGCPEKPVDFEELAPPTTTIDVVINEIFSRGDMINRDWIEIYNPSNSSVDLSGYLIYDIGGQLGSKPKLLFSAGSVIQAKSFLVIVTDDTSMAGFGLSSFGEEVWLENTDGRIIDNVIFPAMNGAAVQSFCRVPDGSTNWVITNVITKGSANNP